MDFDVFERPWCWAFAWQRLVVEAREGRVQMSVREMARRARWRKNEAERFIRELQERGLIRVETGQSDRTQNRTPQILVLTIDLQGENVARLEAHRTKNRTPKPDTPEAVRGPGMAEVREALKLYGLAAVKRGWPVPRGEPTGARRQAIAARLREHGIDGWKEMLRAAMRSPFLAGENERGWRPGGIDWFTQPKNFAKVIEGGYPPREGKPGATSNAARLKSLLRE